VAPARNEVVEYKPEHGAYVAENLRLTDRREIYYLSLMSPWPAIKATASMAVAAWTVLHDGEPAAIFGVNRKTLTSEIGTPWLLGTDVLDRAGGIALAVQSRVYFERMAAAFPMLENWALAENRRTLQYLEWLGFAMDEPMPRGPFGASFVRFHCGALEDRKYLGPGAYRKKIKDGAKQCA